MLIFYVHVQSEYILRFLWTIQWKLVLRKNCLENVWTFLENLKIYSLRTWMWKTLHFIFVVWKSEHEYIFEFKDFEHNLVWIRGQNRVFWVIFDNFGNTRNFGSKGIKQRSGARSSRCPKSKSRPKSFIHFESPVNEWRDSHLKSFTKITWKVAGTEHPLQLNSKPAEVKDKMIIENYSIWFRFFIAH